MFKTIAMMIAMGFLMAGCDERNSEGYPTSLSSHEDLVCEEYYQVNPNLPKMMVDEWRERNPQEKRERVCKCTKDKVKEALVGNADPIQEHDKVYESLKRYEFKDLDMEMVFTYLQYDSIIKSALNGCIHQVGDEIIYQRSENVKGN